MLQASQVTAPLFTYDTLRQRDPYSRLDSDASSLGQSLSPSQQVNKDWIAHRLKLCRRKNSNSLKVGASQFCFFVMHFVKPGIFRGILE